MTDLPLTNLRPLPLRKNLRRGAKVKWVPTSFRFPPDLHEFLKADAKAENVDMSYLVLELIEQYRAYKMAKRRGKPK